MNMAKRDVIDSVIREMAGQPRFGCDELPDRKVITGIISDVQAFMFPAFSSGACVSERMLLEKIRWELAHQIRRAMRFAGDSDLDPDRVADDFLAAIPGIYSLLLKDIEALYEGDPAATSREEVIVAYPGFFAIVVYRIAHVLYEMRVPIIPRIMTEFVHQKTGIDIHAGAKIGEYFFIDHGTGIVIGETTVIGDHVKLYQGVTLGAKSFEVDADGNPVKGIKRHPNIGSHVVIYANATILGGSTTVGDHCVIGGNVWLTHSVEPGQTVYYRAEPSDRG
ncbi:MAG TPA: serine acetyltransferase [Candidatus Faecivicinus avistercoris]|nr:serine acetyltransferase [Candidatus Faecivicinus avistercoris]